MARKIGVFASLLSVAAGVDVNSEDAMRNYCASYCGANNVDNCDFGNGNLGTSVGAPFQELPSDLPTTVVRALRGSPQPAPSPLIPATNASGHGDCDEQHGNTCVQNGNNWGWCNYPQYQCASHYVQQLTGAMYSNIQSHPVDRAEGFVFTQWVDNDSNLQQSTSVAFDETTETSATFSVTNSLEIGMSYSLEVSVPDIMKSSFTESMQVSTSTSSSHTSTNSQKWSVTQNIQVPPRATMKAELLIQKVVVSGDWSAEAKISGTGKLWCGSEVQGHHEWFVPPDNFLPQAYPGACVILGGGPAKCDISGHFDGFQGANSQVLFKQCPLYDRSC